MIMKNHAKYTEKCIEFLNSEVSFLLEPLQQDSGVTD